MSNRLILSACTGLLLAAPAAIAQNNLFLSSPKIVSDWSDTNLWSLGELPNIDHNYIYVLGDRHATVAEDVAIRGLLLGTNGDDNAGRITQSGGVFDVADSLQIYSTPTTDYISYYELGSGTLRANLLRLREGGELRQTGGRVEVWNLAAYADAGNPYTANIKISGGEIHVAHDAVFWVPGFYEEYGTIDFQNSSAGLNLGRGSYAVLSGDSIRNAGNASLTVGAESLLIVEDGVDLNTLFGSVQLNGSHVHTQGSPIHILAGQRIQIGQQDTFTDGLIVQGTVGERLFDPTSFRTTEFRVEAGGILNTARGGNYDLRGNDMGVFGGVARMRYLGLGGTHYFLEDGSSYVEEGLFVLEDGHLQVTKMVGSSSSYGSKLVIQSGLFEAGAVETSFTFDYEQNGGVSRIGEFKVDSTNGTWFNGGVAHVEALYTDGNITNIRHGNAQVIYRTLNLAPASNYIFDAAASDYGGSSAATADLVITGRLQTIDSSHGTKNTINFNNGARSIYSEGAILDFGYQSSQPFRNASNARFYIDEHSLLILAPGVNIASIFNEFVNHGLTHVQGDQLIIDATREIHGTGDLPSDAVVYGRIIADGYMHANQLTVHDGAHVDLKGGVLYSSTSGGGSTHVMGGEVWANALNVENYYQSGGQTTFKLVNGNNFQLSGGESVVQTEFNATVLDFNNGDGRLVLGPGSTALLRNVLNGVNGELHVSENAFVQFYESATIPNNLIGSITGPGLVHVAGDNLVIPEGFTLTTTTTVAGNVRNHGTISPGILPGHNQGEYDTLIFADDLILEAAGSLKIEFDFFDESLQPQNAVWDAIDVRGELTLGGHLEIVLNNGFLPQPTASYKIIDSSISGEFVNIADDGRIYFAGGSFAIDDGNDFFLYDFQLARPGDLNGDNVVDAMDLQIVLNNWAQGVAPNAFGLGDATSDGVVSNDDLLVVLRNYDGELPEGFDVPEPSSLALLSLCSLTVMRRRRSRRA